MMNMIRADLYLITRNKALYITFAVIVAYIILLLFVIAPGVPEYYDAGLLGHTNINGVNIPHMGSNISGLDSIRLLYMTILQMNFIIMVLVVLAAAPIFTNGTVKNDLAWGISRVKLYISKLVISLGLCVVMVLFYMTTGFLMATIANGFGGPAPDGLWLTIIQTLSTQLLMFFASTSIGVFLVFVTKRESLVIGLFIGGTIIPSLLFTILTGLDISLPNWFLYTDIGINISRLGTLELLDAQSIITILSIATIYILATTIGGIAIFKRGSVK